MAGGLSWNYESFVSADYVEMKSVKGETNSDEKEKGFDQAVSKEKVAKEQRKEKFVVYRF